MISDLDQGANNLDFKHVEIVPDLDHNAHDQGVNNLDLKHMEIVADLDHDAHP